MIREKPEVVNGHEACIPNALWEYFEQFCDEQGIGERKEDWMPWWDCWVAAIYADHAIRNMTDGG